MWDRRLIRALEGPPAAKAVPEDAREYGSLEEATVFGQNLIHSGDDRAFEMLAARGVPRIYP